MVTDIDQPEYLLFILLQVGVARVRIKPMLIKLQEGLETNKLKMYMVDIDTNDELCEKCNVTSVPTLSCLKIKKRWDNARELISAAVSKLIKPYC